MDLIPCMCCILINHSIKTTCLMLCRVSLCHHNSSDSWMHTCMLHESSARRAEVSGSEMIQQIPQQVLYNMRGFNGSDKCFSHPQSVCWPSHLKHQEPFLNSYIRVRQVHYPAVREYQCRHVLANSAFLILAYKVLVE